MKKNLSTLFITLLVFLNTTAIFALPTINQIIPFKNFESTTDDQIFDAATANKSLSLIETDAASETVTIKELQADLLTLNRFQQQAKKCTDVNSTQLDKLNQRLTEITAIATPLKQDSDKPQKVTTFTEEQQYLGNKKKEISSQLSECRLFSLRAEQLTTNLMQKIRTVVTTRLLYAHPNILENIEHLTINIDQIWQSFDGEVLAKESGIRFFEDKNVPLLLLPLFIVFAIFYSHNRLKKKIIPLIGDTTEISSSMHIKQALIAILSRYFPAFAGVFVLAIFFSIFTHSLINPSYLALTSYALLGYISYLALIRFYFYPPPPAEGFTALPTPIAKTLTKRLIKFGLLSFITYITYIVFNDQHAINHPFVDLFRNITITLFSINLISIIWVVKNFQTKNHYTALRLSTNLFLTFFLLFILATEYLGYHLLAFYLLFGLSMTVLLIFCTRLTSKLIAAIFDTFKDSDRPWQKKLRSSFGLKSHERLMEILWLRALCYTVLWLIFLVALLKIWGLAQANFQIFINYLIYGFDIGKLHIIPLRIIEGALFFIFLALITRWVRAYIIKNANWQLETGSRESLASIIGYLGFAVAFILGALIAGVNFSGLAIVAGALAVGIGFGLQNIVNNFVSGIVLLIERPIKLGDRIVIGQTEGYVKKISIRSTHIITPQLSDVIVPNSELIAQQVVNYMLHDMNFKISIAIGIAYGSDTDLVKNVLLSIAKTHPEVVANRKDIAPEVYFRTFGASSLNFELSCVVKDVNLRTSVISDLNFAIDKAFREKGIEIAFPQSDIRIKELPQTR
jgi:potassium efflux system protein